MVPSMLSDPTVFALAFKMLATALVVVAAAVAAEKAGPRVGGIIASLPVSAGPSFIFLSFQADDAFIATAALASMVAIADTALVSPPVPRRRAGARRHGIQSRSRRFKAIAIS